MDLERVCSALESVEDNGAIGACQSSDHVADKGENDGLFSITLDKQEDGDVNGTALETEERSNSMLAMVSKALVSPSSGTVPKGYGLRKWRRIKREVTKDGVGNVDSGKLLKRGLPNAVVQSGKLGQVSVETKQQSEGSVSSTSAIDSGLVDGLSMHGNSRLVMGPVFAAGTDSENSEDQSSKSSTAANVPQMRYEGPVVVGHRHDKYRMRSFSGKNLGNMVPRVQQGKIRAETSKKARGDKVKIEKENSHSSVESDSRSSNFLFMQSTSVTSNGRQNGMSLNYDGNSSDDAHRTEERVSKDLQAGHGSKNGEDVSRGDVSAGISLGGKGGTSENQGFTTDQDLLIQPIQQLQAVQEVLEREVQKFREIGYEDTLGDSSQDSSLPPELISAGLQVHPSSSEQLHSGDHVSSFLHTMESEINSLKENIHVLESKLDHVTSMLKIKEAEVAELERAIKKRSPKQEAGSGIESAMLNSIDLESKLEALFQQQVEAEIVYLTISRTLRDLRVESVEEQRRLASEQSWMLNKLGDAESKKPKLKREAEVLENHCEDIAIAGDALKLQSSVYKYASCFVLQLMLLAVVLLFLLQLKPLPPRAVPT